MRYIHPYHIVDISPWPVLISFVITTFGLSLVTWITSGKGSFQLIFSIITILFILFLWFRDIVRESQGGFHTKIIQRGIIISFLLFLSTEIMLFVSFFWAFFNSSLAPAIDLGSVWPPVGVTSVDPWGLPLFGSCILLASGFILTLGHHQFFKGIKDFGFFLSLVTTVLLGISFTVVQFIEYSFAEFTINDSVFGTVFYSTTGLHFLHVVIGTLFLTISFIRIYLDQLTTEHNLSLEFSIYYWHLVDVVWLFVFFWYYYWGGA